MSKKSKSGISKVITKKQRKKLVEPLLKGDYFHAVEFGNYVYVKKWDGNKQRWEIAEFTRASYARMWAWNNNIRLDQELVERLAKEE